MERLDLSYRGGAQRLEAVEPPGAARSKRLRKETMRLQEKDRNQRHVHLRMMVCP